MGNLGPRRVKDIFRNWLQADTGNQGVNGTLVRVQDGKGTNLPIRLSTAEVRIDGNLTVDGTLTGTVHTVTSITGNAGTATALQAGGADRIKLDGIATGATANSSDATLLNRTNHTGTQAISTVTNLQTSLDAKAPLASPTFTGVPAAPTAAVGTNTTQIATTAYVRGEVNALINAAPGTLDTLDELAAALGDDANFAATVTTSLAAKAPLASPALTGTPTAPTASTGTNTTQIATTAFVNASVTAGTASPTFTGVVTIPAGAVGAPSLTTTGDTNTGLWFPAADTVAVSTAGAERLRVRSNGITVINSDTNAGTGVDYPLQVNGTASGVAPGAVVSRWSADTTAPVYALAKSRGTAVGTRGIVADGDTLGQVIFRGDDGTGWIGAAEIRAQVDGTPGTNDMPGRLSFLTTADGASAVTERMRIDSSGNVGIGTTSTTANRVRIGGNVTGGTTAYQLQASATIQSDVSGTSGCFVTAPATAATAFTLSNLYHFYATQPALGAGSAVTSQMGFHAGSSLTGATNNYGFYSNLASATGRYNFYAAGTADNFFNGHVQISGTKRLIVATTDPGSIGASAANPPRVVIDGTSSSANCNIAMHNTSSGGQVAGEIWHAKSLAAGGTPTVTNGVLLGASRFYGHDSAAFGEAAVISVQADAAMSAGSTPGRMMFSTTASGAVAATERMRITSAGYVQIGGTTANIAQVFVNHDSATAPTALLLRDSLATGAADSGNTVEFNFNDGSSNRSTGYIKCLKENATVGNTAAYMILGTRAAGSGGVSERLRISSEGVITVAANGYVTASGTEWSYRQINTSSTIGHRNHHLFQRSLSAGAVTAGTNLGGLAMGGHTGSGYTSGFDGGAEISAFAEGTWTTSSAPTRLAFYTTAASSVTPGERARIDSDGVVLVGSTASRQVGSVGGSSYGVQIEKLGMAIVRNSSSNAAAFLTMGKSRGTVSGAVTIVQADDELARMEFCGADGVDLNSPAARISVFVDGTPGSDDLPGRMLFYTTPDGSATPAERMRIDNAGKVGVNMTPAAGVFGNTGRLCVAETSVHPAQFMRFAADAFGCDVQITKSRHATIGSHTIVQSGDTLANIQFGGSDGSAYQQAAAIAVQVDGTPGASDMPGRMLFYTTPDGSATVAERMRITASGTVSVGGAYDAEGLRVTQTASAVNRVEVTGATTGNSPVLRSNGSNTNIALTVGTTGTGQISFATNGAATEQARIAHVASAVNYILMQGGATGTPPIIQTGGSDTNRDIKLSAAGTGVVDLGTTSATTATAGAQTLPANPAGFLNLKLNGTAIKVPYYNA
jgi:hypothetical protein